MFNKILGIVLKIIISILFYKNFLRKYRNLWQYSLAVRESIAKENVYFTIFMSSLLIMYDASIPIYLLMFRKIHFEFLIYVLCMQIYFLFKMIALGKKQNKKNCGCYIMNFPRKVTLNEIMKNMVVIYIVMIIFLIQ